MYSAVHAVVTTSLFVHKAAFTPDTCSRLHSIPDEQLVSGYKWIHVLVAVTTISSPIQDTCRRQQAIQKGTNGYKLYPGYMYQM